MVNQTFDLFDKLGATEEQLDFPVVYASALNGYAIAGLQHAERPHARVVRGRSQACCPRPRAIPTLPLQLQISALDYSSYVGRIGIGRIARGRMKPGQEVLVMRGPEDKGETCQGQPGAGFQRSGPGAAG